MSQEIIDSVLPVEECDKRKQSLTVKYTRVIRACSICAGDYEDPDMTSSSREDETHDDTGDEEDFREPLAGLRN
jgi:hypothetical protein